RECHHQILVLQGRTERITRGDRPELCRFSVWADNPGQQPPIGAEGCCPDPASQVSVPSLCAGGYVPQLSGAVVSSNQAGCAIGTESDTKGFAPGIAEWFSNAFADLLAGGGVPELDGAVRISRQKRLSVCRDGYGPNLCVVPHDRPQRVDPCSPVPQVRPGERSQFTRI